MRALFSPRTLMAVAAIAALSSAPRHTLDAQVLTLPNQGAASPRVPKTPATTPPSGTTTGYWQQRADYQIVAQLDEARGLVKAQGTLCLLYTSPSPRDRQKSRMPSSA